MYFIISRMKPSNYGNDIILFCLMLSYLSYFPSVITVQELIKFRKYDYLFDMLYVKLLCSLATYLSSAPCIF